MERGKMKRKRTNLDKAEAEYLYANVLLEFSKYDTFKDLSILEKNNIIDQVSLNAVKQAHSDEDDIEAVTQEILSYKLTDEELKDFYSADKYISDVEKPSDYNLMLEKRYSGIIKRLVADVIDTNKKGD